MNNEELKLKLISLTKGDETAFEEIYTSLKTPIYTIIYRMTKDKTISEDILHEVFLKLYQSPPSPLIKNPRAYIFQIAHNLTIDNIRKIVKYTSLDNIEDKIYISPYDTSDRLDIEAAMNTLPPIECEILTLHINGEFKFREISQIMNMPMGTVLWKYQKAIVHIRSKLDGGAL